MLAIDSERGIMLLWETLPERRLQMRIILICDLSKLAFSNIPEQIKKRKPFEGFPLLELPTVFWIVWIIQFFSHVARLAELDFSRNDSDLFNLFQVHIRKSLDKEGGFVHVSQIMAFAEIPIRTANRRDYPYIFTIFSHDNKYLLK